jgi:hypothetical protein
VDPEFWSDKEKIGWLAIFTLLLAESIFHQYSNKKKHQTDAFLINM